MQRKYGVILAVVSMSILICQISALGADKVVVVPLGSSTAITSEPSDIVSIYKVIDPAGPLSVDLLSLPSTKGFVMTGITLFSDSPFTTFRIEEGGISENVVKFSDNLLDKSEDIDGNMIFEKSFTSGVSFSTGSSIVYHQFNMGGGGAYQMSEVLIQGFYR